MPSNPFTAPDDEWESELAAWDAAIPIVNRPGGEAPPGVVPHQENPFLETPATLVSPGQVLDLDDLPELASAGAFDDGLLPTSGSYAALVAIDHSVPGLFERDPPAEPPPIFPVETLREMSPGPWADALGSLIALGPASDSGAVTAPPRAYWETLATIIAEERAVVASGGGDRDAREVALGLAAARLADVLDQSDAARGHLDAVVQIDSTCVAAQRARLVLAERAGLSDDEGSARALTRLALLPHPDQAYYRALHAEWALARAAHARAAAAAGPHSVTRNDSSAAAVAVGSLPDGLARSLAEAELAWHQPSAAAAILESAAHRVGGALGAALLLCAAGLNEQAQDFQAAAEQRFVAARLDDQRSLASLGVLRDLARLEAEAVVPALEDLMGRLPPSPLKAALARWGAAAALRAGDPTRAWRMVSAPASLGPMTAALARDRLDLWPPLAGLSAGRVAPELDAPTLSDLAASPLEFWSSPLARVCVNLRICEQAASDGDLSFAVAMADQVVAAVGDAAPLGPALEQVAGRASDARTRVRALRLWRRVDPARWTAASLDLADMLVPTPDARTVDEETDSTESVLGEIATRDPTSPVFWALALLTARRGRFAEAAAHLDQGLARPDWASSPFAAPLAELAGELTARSDLAAAAVRLAADRSRPDGDRRATPATTGRQLTRARVLRQLGDPDLWAQYLEDEIAAFPVDPLGERARHRRAGLLLEPVFWDAEAETTAEAPRGEGAGETEDVPALVAAALDVVPLHPVAFGLALGAQPDPTMLVDRLGAGAAGPDGPRWLLAASVTAAVAGDARRGLALAVAARDADSDGAVSRGGGNRGTESASPTALARGIDATIRRMVWAAPDAEYRARILRARGQLIGTADALVEAAEAAETPGAAEAPVPAEARRLFEAAAFAPGGEELATDIQMGLERLSAQSGAGAGPSRDPGGPVPVAPVGPAGERRRERDRLRELERAARAERWDEVVTGLVDPPPRAEPPGAAVLSLAAALDEGRGAGARAPQIWSRARAALLTAGEATPPADPGAAAARATVFTAWLRAGDHPGEPPAERIAACERLADAAGSDARSAALLLVEAARLAGALAGSDDGANPPPGPGSKTAARAATSPTTAERCLHAAVLRDPTSAPAVIAWRRWLTAAGRTDEAGRLAAAEAEALLDPTFRVEALLRGAAMLMSPAPGDAAPARPPGSGADRLNQTVALLDRALHIDPQQPEAFRRLRDLFEEAGRHADLARLLARRLTVTSNPFEVTALRLARAEIFADALADPARAKTELEAILQKEPQHARALARLADLEEEAGNDAAAADLLIRRAFMERSPEKLRDLFLRLGRIYTQRLPDAKRAVGAYARVLQLDANNREAMDELSRLYLGLGETRSAIAITERLVNLEAVPERRSRYHLRLAQLAERASDSRGAALYFRRAAEEAPRDVEVLGELVRHLEKTRDTAGRRAYLDRAAGDLRVAVLANPTDAAAIEALVAVLRWRGRAAAAAAAAELLVLAGTWRAASAESPVTFQVPDGAAAPPGGRTLAGLADPSVDQDTFPATVPSSVRHLFRLLAPVLSDSSKPEVSRHGVDRTHRVAPGRPPRDAFDAVAAELTAGPFELYVRPGAIPTVAAATGGAASSPLIVEPGRPPAIVLGAPLLTLGPDALRFAAARSLRLTSTHLDLALAAGPLELGLWMAAVIRQFVPDYRHAALSDDSVATRAARVAKLLPRKLRQEIMPFAMESAGVLDLEELHLGIRDGANRVGLVACGSLAAGLSVVLLTASNMSRGSGSSPEALARSGEAQALLAFALSDAHDDLVRGLG